MKKLIRKKQLSSVKPGEKSFRKKKKNVFVFFLPGESFYWNKSLGRRNLQEKEVGFFSRRIWENQVKKNFLSLKKKIGEKCMCAFFPKLNFFFFREKKCKLLFLLLENSLYLKQCFYVFLSFFLFFLQENFQKKLKKVSFSQIQRKILPEIFSQSKTNRFLPPSIIQTEMYVFITILTAVCLVALKK